MGSAEGPLPMSALRSSILFIDAYDSYSNNITSLLTTLLDVNVRVLPIDAPISKDDFRRELRHYEAVVCGPGPGTPGKDADVGLMRLLWELDDHDLLPVLGVCLGFQSLVLACGGNVRRLKRGLHGMIRTIQHRPKHNASHCDGDIFQHVGEFKATLYHSLCADVGQDSVRDWEAQKWNTPARHSDIVPLGWVVEDRGNAQETERILMALKHRRKPFWGLQYHPESICTESEGHKVLQNWFAQARRWNVGNRKLGTQNSSQMMARNSVKSSLHDQASLLQLDAEKGGRLWRKLAYSDATQKLWSRSIPLPEGVEAPHIAEMLGLNDGHSVVFDSANGNQPAPTTGVDVRGRFSILAADVGACLRIEYHTGDDFLTIFNGLSIGNKEIVALPPGRTVWHFLAEFHETRRSQLECNTARVPEEHAVPFLGGFVGFVTYEQGLSGIDIQLPKDRGHNRPDVCLAWIQKSLVIDHQTQVVHVQELGPNASWIVSAAQQLQNSALWRYGIQNNHNTADKAGFEVLTVIKKPDSAKYEAKVRMCQDFIAAGESYELCLTDQTRITRVREPKECDSVKRSSGQDRTERSKSHIADASKDSSWQLYRTLRSRNPAPYASYVRLGGTTLVSSSPERFLEYDRAGLCSMKPMKGTVKKCAEPGEGCATTLAEAEAILNTPKEQAENLMIVDLVRHDLHGICGAGNVTVPDLLKVEEYQTVYTMISRVQGQLPLNGVGDDGSIYSGLDVLAASLPPGSMTGAPKKRSCEILQQIEGGKERSLYSGVVGYMCVTGRGDWSVTIRSMFRWDDESTSDSDEESGTEVWHIGAGGAVTILSTAEGEREEMFVKLARPLSIFSDAN
ncbi:ADC synthase [Coniella lustricola]|uniref:aminodeoxychorismate synthase n=1 Tax=Coniella lustricola TaxID=2025994 RepID=A0A2T3AJS1_9PEZI|nr:ADC synthase [Coniella lustricola]